MKKFFILPLLSLVSFGLYSQNLNPEVQVTGEYQNKIEEMPKAIPDMPVPDSLMHFDYHFDYTVLNSPYKGSYEFAPYSVTITPDKRPYDGRKLYVNAGAGYNFRPEFDAVWAAVDRKDVAVDVFGHFKGFYGQYYGVQPGTFLKVEDSLIEGYDFIGSVGADSRFRFGKVGLKVEASYDAIFRRHIVYHRNNTSAPTILLGASYDNGSWFAVSGSARYRYIDDWLNGQKENFTDHEVNGDVNFIFSPKGGYKILTDVEFAVNSFFWGVGIRPHAVFSLGAFDFDAGFRAGYVSERFTVNPDVLVSVRLLNDYLKIYASAKGTDHYTSYWDYKTRIHQYFHALYGAPRALRETADLCLGVGGHTRFGLQYDVKAGYRWLADAPFWTSGTKGHECFYFADCEMVHADMSLEWVADRFNVAAAAHFVKIPQGLPEGVYEPSLVTASISGGYNWLKRIYAGLSLEMGTERATIVDGERRALPMWFNLGVRADYKLNRNWAFWLKGTNLLNQEIRISPLYAEYGPAVTLGATFNL